MKPIKESDGLFATLCRRRSFSRTNSGGEGGATESADGDIWRRLPGWQVTYSRVVRFRGVWIPSDVIGDVFFPPNQGGDASTIEAFAVFGEPLMRPIRGVCCSDTLVTFTEESGPW
jgi:hypothetical protein